MVNRIAAMLGFKRQTNENKYLEATLRIVDQMSKQHVSTDQASLIRRVSGYIAICIRLNAQSTTAVRVRLYRKGSPGKRSRSIDKWTHKRLRDPMAVGLKAAQVADKASEDVVEVLDHPALEMLNKPNPWVPGEAYWDRHQRFKEACGNAYDHIVVGKDRDYLFGMMPQFVTIQPDTSDFVGGYWYGRDSGKRVWFPSHEVGHAKFEESLFDPFYGTSPLSSILPESDLRAMMNTFATSLFSRGARPDVHLHWEGATEDTLKKLKADFTREYTGQENAGKWFMSGGSKVTLAQLGFAPKDLEYLAGRAKLESDIAAAFGVPESFLRLNEANLASSTSGHHAYQKYTILPRAVRRSDYLGDLILYRILGLDPEAFWFAIDDPVSSDFKAIEDGTRSDVLAGILTANEARLARGYEKSDDANAEVLLINGRPLAEAMPEPMGGFGGFGGFQPIRPEEPKKPTADAADGADAEITDTEVQEVKSLPAKCCEHKAGTEVSHKSLWLDGFKDDDAAEEVETPEGMVEAIERVFQNQRDEIVAAMQANPSGKQARGMARKATQAEVDRLLKAWGIADLDDRWTSVLLEAVKDDTDAMLIRAATEGVRSIRTVVESAEGGESVGDFDLQSDRAGTFVRMQTADLLETLQNVNRTTAEQLAATIAEGVDNGEALSSMVTRVREAFDSETSPGVPTTRYRAQMIARTETARAHTNGTLAGWADSDVVEGKQWFTSANPCEFCEAVGREFNEKSVSLDKPFFARGTVLRGSDGGLMNLDFSDVQGSPLHPHCKCSVQPILRRG